MKFALRTTFFSALLCGSLMMPSLASAHQLMVMRPDGISFQGVYSMRGHRMFVNRVSRRNLRQAVVEVNQTVLPKEII